MNGLEAIKFMEKGNMVIRHVDDSNNIIFKIEDENVYYKFLKFDSPFRIDTGFNLSANYEEYIEPKLLTGWERVENGEEFHTLFLERTTECEYGVSFDNRAYRVANYFSTKEKAEEINFKQTLFRKLQRFSDENGGSEIDWKDHNQWKFYICYRYDCEVLVTYRTSYVKDFGIVYFISEEVTEKAIELFHDDLIKYFTHDWNAGGNE